jgi:hypothetical protein
VADIGNGKKDYVTPEGIRVVPAPIGSEHYWQTHVDGTQSPDRHSVSEMQGMSGPCLQTPSMHE